MGNEFDNVIIATNTILLDLLTRAYAGEEPDKILEELWAGSKTREEYQEDEEL